MQLFFARRAGVTIAHNLTEQDVFELRLSQDASNVTVFEQDKPHGLGQASFCPDCAEIAADIAWAEGQAELMALVRGAAIL